MAMNSAHWTITRATGDIRYTGPDHGLDAAASYATVIEFHRWLQDFADQAEFSGDDELDIIDNTPSDRSTDNIITLTNGFNIDDISSEHLFDGSIIQDAGDTIYDGIVNFGNVGIRIQLLQAGNKIADDWWNYNVGGTDDTSSSAAFMTDSGESYTDDEFIGYTILNVTDGSEAVITDNDATTITGILFGGGTNLWNSGDVYLISEGLNSAGGSGISARWMTPVRRDGVDIDLRKLVGTNRTFFRTYGEFVINQTARGNNVLALNDAPDLNNTTAIATVDGWSSITNTEGLRDIDIDAVGGTEQYYSEWNRDVFTINQFFERTKFLSRDSSAETLNGLDGEEFRGPTHSLNHDNETGAAPTTNDELAFGTNLIYDTESGAGFDVGEAIHENTATPVWVARILAVDDNGVDGSLIVSVEGPGVITTGDAFTGQTSNTTAAANGTPTVVTTGGVFRVYAYDDQGTTGFTYGQLMEGRSPVENDRMFFGGATADVARFIDVDDTVTARTISTPYVGVSTGTALIGAYGLGMEAADAGVSDIFFDLNNDPVNPPNNVTFTVDGLFSGEDYVVVGTDDGSDFDFNHYTLNGVHNSGTQTTITVNGAIDSETPSPSGTIRVTRDDGLISRHPYSTFTGSVFTITSADFASNPAAGGNNVFTSYIDVLASGTSENFQYTYSGDRTVFIRVRDGGTAGDGFATKGFEGTGTVGTGGGTVTAIRPSDV